MVKITIDGREIETEHGTNLLHVCLEKGIYIPNLCYIEGLESPAASCRLCFVEIEGKIEPTTSCTTKVKEGMIVKTDTEAVRRLQRAAFNLLLSNHRVECASCPGNKKCELQRIAKFLKVGLKVKGLGKVFKDEESLEHPFLEYLPNRCVLCGKCVHVCREKNDLPVLTFAKRGFKTVLSSFGHDVLESQCQQCKACIDICPVSALLETENAVEVQA